MGIRSDVKKEQKICCLPDVTIYCTQNLQNYLSTRTFVIFLDAIPFRKKKSKNLKNICTSFFFSQKLFVIKKLKISISAILNKRISIVLKKKIFLEKKKKKKKKKK